MGLPPEDQPLRYPPILTTLAKDHETNWREAAHAEVVRARDALADRSTFGGAPAARAFGTVYAAAATEYTETLKGIQDDLVTAARNLAIWRASTTRSARPSTITGSRGSSVVMAQRGSAARLRALRERTPLENHSRPSRHTPQTGITCGAPSGRTVAHQ